MALATTVTGAGKVMNASIEGSGNFNYFTASGGTVTQHTITFTESRVTRKWYALTLGACEAYATANPGKNPVYNCTNEQLNSYELFTEVVERTIVDHSTAVVPEPEA